MVQCNVLFSRDYRYKLSWIFTCLLKRNLMRSMDRKRGVEKERESDREEERGVEKERESAREEERVPERKKE